MQRPIIQALVPVLVTLAMGLGGFTRLGGFHPGLMVFILLLAAVAGRAAYQRAKHEAWLKGHDNMAKSEAMRIEPQPPMPTARQPFHIRGLLRAVLQRRGWVFGPAMMALYGWGAFEIVHILGVPDEAVVSWVVALLLGMLVATGVAASRFKWFQTAFNWLMSDHL